MTEAEASIDADELQAETLAELDCPPPRPLPVRRYQLDALRRRRDSVAVSARAALDARIAQIEQSLSQLAVEPAPVPQGEAATHVSGLSELVTQLQARHLPQAAQVVESPASVGPEAPPAPRTSLLQETRAVWQKVRTQSHLRRARTKPLEHAGPLNSTKLVGRTLEVIGEISPGYQQHFMAYLDVLAELDALVGVALASEAVAPKRASRPRAPRKRKENAESQ